MTAKKDTVNVSFNGQEKPIDFQEQAATESLLAHSRDAFGANNQHTLGLFTAENVELQPYTNSIASFGIKPGQLLFLKPSTVRGGDDPC